jgi:hypothetical protein
MGSGQPVRSRDYKPIFWLNAFGWTFLQKKVGDEGHEAVRPVPQSHVPFITWKVQDDAIVDLVDAIDNGHDALIHKSRDMGASWIVVGFSSGTSSSALHDVPGTQP